MTITLAIAAGLVAAVVVTTGWQFGTLILIALVVGAMCSREAQR